MKIYDISQEVFGCKVFPGDPSPEKLTMLKIDDGKTIDRVDIDRFVGYAYVTEHEGNISAEDALRILQKARECDGSPCRAILIEM